MFYFLYSYIWDTQYFIGICKEVIINMIENKCKILKVEDYYILLDEDDREEILTEEEFNFMYC